MTDTKKKRAEGDGVDTNASREMLRRMGQLKTRVRQITAELAGLIADSGNPLGAYGKANKIIADMFLQRITDLAADIDMIERRIDTAGLTDVELRYIIMRYVNMQKVSAIAIELQYSERQCERIHLWALEKIAHRLENHHFPSPPQTTIKL
ncbi:MAG: hypothetical protein RR588_03410 [Solibacillus sp.]